MPCILQGIFFVVYFTTDATTNSIVLQIYIMLKDSTQDSLYFTIDNVTLEEINGGLKYTINPHSSLNKYRFGWNGAENLDEIKGRDRTPDLGDRPHDPLTGRLNWKVDRKAAEYPWQSPYAYFGNSPISVIDYNGEGPPPNNRKPVNNNTVQSVAIDNTAVLDIKTDFEMKLQLPSDIEKAMMFQKQQKLKQGGVAGTEQYQIFKARLETAYEVSKFAPVTGDIHDASSVVYNIGTGNYKAAAMSAVFLIPFADFAKAIKPIFKLDKPITKALANEFEALAKTHNISNVNITDGGTGKFAVIGQTMNRVNESAGFFSKTGAEIKTFQASKDALEQWKDVLNKYDGKVISDNVIKGTKLYQENVTWINKMKNQGYGFIDIGEDATAKIKSTFYNMEKTQVYGKK